MRKGLHVLVTSKMMAVQALNIFSVSFYDNKTSLREIWAQVDITHIVYIFLYKQIFYLNIEKRMSNLD